MAPTDSIESFASSSLRVRVVGPPPEASNQSKWPYAFALVRAFKSWLVMPAASDQKSYACLLHARPTNTARAQRRHRRRIYMLRTSAKNYQLGDYSAAKTPVKQIPRPPDPPEPLDRQRDNFGAIMHQQETTAHACGLNTCDVLHLCNFRRNGDQHGDRPSRPKRQVESGRLVAVGVRLWIFNLTATTNQRHRLGRQLGYPATTPPDNVRFQGVAQRIGPLVTYARATG